MTLQKDLISPFVPQPKPLLDPDKEKNQDEDSNEEKILDGQHSIDDSEQDENTDTRQEIDESTDDSDSWNFSPGFINLLKFFDIIDFEISFLLSLTMNVLGK